MRMPIPDDWDGTEYCRFAVCWPNSPKWLAVLRGQATEIARGWFWDEASGNLLDTLDAARQTLDNNIELPGVLMACGDAQLSEIAAAINALAAAQCCDGVPSNGGIQGSVDDGAGGSIPVFGEAPPFDYPIGEVPPDFPGTLEEYDQAKCATAAAIVAGAIQTARNLAYINFAQTAGLVALVVAATGGFIVLPIVAIPLLIAAAIVLVETQALLIAFADGMQDEFDGLVCALVENNGTTTILTAVSAIISTILVAIPATGLAATFLRLVAGIIFNTDVLSQLFSAQAGQAPPYDCNCDDCSSENDIIFEFDADTEPFALDPDFVTSEPAYNGQSGEFVIQWDPGNEAMAIGTGVSANNHALAIADVDHMIGLGDNFYVQHATAAGTISYGCMLLDDSGEIIVVFFEGTTSGNTFATSLDAYVGQHVAHIGVFVARAAAGNYTSRTKYIRITCG